MPDVSAAGVIPLVVIIWEIWEIWALSQAYE